MEKGVSGDHVDIVRCHPGSHPEQFPSAFSTVPIKKSYEPIVDIDWDAP